ncbi:MAG: peptidylprolyl isomerase [Dehalococcoidia bacterium]|nr:peptidylprolyl isomerase [Dehalococcoidia bacterium]
MPTAAPTNTPATAASDLPAASPTSAATAVRTPTTAPLRFPAADKVIDAATKDYTAVIATAKGEITIKLFDDRSPNTVNAFVFLARKGFYNNITFHRVVSGFVVQAGDPTGTGGGGPGFETEQEPNDYKNQAGYVSMARAAGSTKFGSQWFINLANNAALDQDMPNQARFYPFGQVTKGMDVVLAIRQGDRIQTITIIETPQGQ